MIKMILILLLTVMMSVSYAEETKASFDKYIFVKNEPKFKCDGRKYCSQMRSCEEAKFFIKNCPNTKMDGDNDGVPCEEQWCGH